VVPGEKQTKAFPHRFVTFSQHPRGFIGHNFATARNVMMNIRLCFGFIANAAPAEFEE